MTSHHFCPFSLSSPNSPMATTKLVQPPPFPSPHLVSHLPKLKITLISLSASPPPPRGYHTGFKLCPFASPRTNHQPLRAAAASAEGLLEEDEKDTIALTKSSIYQALEGINRGVFGATSAKRREIEDLVIKLESQNPTPNPTLHLEKVSGCWKLVYSTITILGSKRTKLGLRDFITLGDFLQIIDVAKGKAVNVIKFSARGFSFLNGQLTIQSSFNVASSSRVNIKFENSQITPDQKNYDLLLSIFNPEGWLEITYVDDTMKIGRDDKGNIFILERSIIDDGDQP